MSLNDQNFFCPGYYFPRDQCTNPSTSTWSTEQLGRIKQACSVCQAPVNTSIQNTVKTLGNYYKANKIYLVYHNQFPINEYKANLEVWVNEAKKHSITIVPTFLLYNYDFFNKANFTNNQLTSLVDNSLKTTGSREIGVFDVVPDFTKRNYTSQLLLLTNNFPGITISRIGGQPNESPGSLKTLGYQKSVNDTWSYLAACQKNEDWNNNKAGDSYTKNDLATYVKSFKDIESAWNLVTVGWGYEPHETQNSCIFVKDDAKLNDPISPQRNILASQAICQNSSGGSFGGFSTDLYILGVTSNETDPRARNFLSQLKKGQVYSGKFRNPLEEIKQIYSRKNLCQ